LQGKKKKRNLKKPGSEPEIGEEVQENKKKFTTRKSVETPFGPLSESTLPRNRGLKTNQEKSKCSGCPIIAAKGGAEEASTEEGSSFVDSPGKKKKSTKESGNQKFTEAALKLKRKGKTGPRKTIIEREAAQL